MLNARFGMFTSLNDSSDHDIEGCSLFGTIDELIFV